MSQREKVAQQIKEATRSVREMQGMAAQMNEQLDDLNVRAAENNRKLAAWADRVIARKGYGWRRLKVIRERDRLRAALRAIDSDPGDSDYDRDRLLLLAQRHATAVHSVRDILDPNNASDSASASTKETN